MAIGLLAIRVRYDMVSVACDYTVCLHLRVRNVHLLPLRVQLYDAYVELGRTQRGSCKC